MTNRARRAFAPALLAAARRPGAFCWAALLALLAPDALCRAGEAPAWPALKPAAPLPAALKLLDDTTSGDFDLRLHYGQRSPAGWQAVVLFDRKDDANAYRLSLAPGRTSLARVQLGLELELAAGEGIGTAKAGTLLVRRRGALLELFAGGHLLLAAHDDTFTEGGAGYGSAGGFSFDNARLQPVEPVYFSDDFMRTEEERGDWEALSGKWQVKSLRNAIRSPNAFTYFGQGGSSPAVSLTGEWFWSDYQFGASAMGTGTRALGIVACHQDKENYLLFEWTARAGSAAGDRRLVAVRQGKREVLAQGRGGYRPGHWYDLALSVQGGDVRAYVDGSLVLAGKTAPLPGGRAGLYVADPKGAYFDDAWCESGRDVTYDFSVPGELAAVSHGAWQAAGGQWAVVKRGSELLCEARTASPAHALVGSPAWTDYEVSAGVARPERGSAGLCLCYQDEGSYALLRTAAGDPNTIELARVSDGKESVLESTKVAPARGLRRLSARLDRGVITAYADGVRLFEHYDPAFVGGRAGLYAESCPAALFGAFSVHFAPHERAPIFTAQEVFTGEVSMTRWAAAQSDWVPVTAKVGGADVECRWHRAPFFGDVEIEADMAPAKGALGLMLAAADQAPNSGYLLTVANKTLALSRAGVEVARADLKSGAATATIRLRKEGGTLIAMVDGVACLSYRDHKPLQGLNAGWYGTGAAVAKDSVNIYSDNVITDFFHKAPSDWRPAGGAWDVQNRWQCDPRWSFFSGVNFQGPAVLWNKRSFEGDQTVEFAAGIKMAREHGSYSDYGRDIDVTLCADGKNVDSGYSFVFAGWGNTKCAILRQGKVVAEAPPPKLDDSIHHKWFLVRAEKRGSSLKYYVDDTLLCEYNDPHPLDGTRLALWTYKCGIMVSRFRACAQKIGPREPASDAWPAVSRTFYK